MPDDFFDERDQAREHRAGAWLLLFVGLVAFGLGTWRLRGSIVQAFQKDAPAYKSSDELEQERIASLKTKDTDKDGISDYDEMYVFHTSPYLADSDGDGIDDKTEIEHGTDPNCPEGKTCGPLGGGAVAAETPPASATGTPPDASAESQYVQQLLNPTPAQVRQFLIDSGAKKEDIDKLDDATLMQMYQQALLEAQASQSGAPAPASP